MKNVAAFYWDNKAKEVYFGVYDLDAGIWKVKTQVKKILNQQDAYNAIVAFTNELNRLQEDGVVEFKVVAAAPPWQTIHNPNALSNYILTTITNAVNALPNWALQKQVKAKLKKPELEHFKKSLVDLKIVGKGSTAWEWHLFAVLVHATKKTYAKSLAPVWSVIKGVSLKTKDGKLQFQEWKKQMASQP